MNNKKILICSYSHKTFFNSGEINNIILGSLKNKKSKNIIQNISDGGEGISLMFNKPEKKIILYVEDAQMLKKKVIIGVYNGRALIEVSKIIGGFDKKFTDGMYRSSYGIGTAIKQLYLKGIKKFIIGFGGSTVSDFGIGLAYSLGIRFYKDKSKLIQIEGKILNAFKLKKILRIECRDFFFLNKKISLDLLSDSNIKIIGKNGQVNIYAKQKNIIGKNRQILKYGFINFKKILEKTFKKKLDKPYMGAGGGTVAMLYSIFNCKLYSGHNYLAKKISLENQIKKSDIIITGEGFFDKSSKTKGIWKIIDFAKKYKKIIILIVGKSKLIPRIENFTLYKMFDNQNMTINKRLIKLRTTKICQNLIIK